MGDGTAPRDRSSSPGCPARCRAGPDPPSRSLQEIPRHCEEGGGEETPHQEAAQCLHVVHEGDEGQGGGRVHAEGERRHQPDPGQTGTALSLGAARLVTLKWLSAPFTPPLPTARSLDLGHRQPRRSRGAGGDLGGNRMARGWGGRGGSSAAPGQCVLVASSVALGFLVWLWGLQRGFEACSLASGFAAWLRGLQHDFRACSMALGFAA